MRICDYTLHEFEEGILGEISPKHVHMGLHVVEE